MWFFWSWFEWRRSDDVIRIEVMAPFSSLKAAATLPPLLPLVQEPSLGLLSAASLWLLLSESCFRRWRRQRQHQPTNTALWRKVAAAKPTGLLKVNPCFHLLFFFPTKKKEKKKKKKKKKKEYLVCATAGLLRNVCIYRHFTHTPLHIYLCQYVCK